MISLLRYKWTIYRVSTEDNIPWLVENILADLSPEDCMLVKLRFGLAGNNEYSCKKVAEILNKPEDEIRAMEKAAIASIRLSRKKGRR